MLHSSMKAEAGRLLPKLDSAFGGTEGSSSDTDAKKGSLEGDAGAGRAAAGAARVGCAA